MNAPRGFGGGILLVTVLVSASGAWAEESSRGDILYRGALALQARSEAEEASAAFERACQARSAEACLRLVSAALDAGDDERAEEYLHMAREAAPEDGEIRLALARTMARLGNYMWAIRELQALQQEGHDVDFELGYCMFQLEQHEQAAELLMRASDSGPARGVSALYAASALERLEQGEEAARLARRAADSGDDPEVARAGVELLRALRGGMVAERVPFAIDGVVSLSYDSNPVLGPDDAPSNAGGPRLGFQLGLLTEPLGGDSWRLGGRIFFARDQSFTEQARSFDLTSAQGALFGRFFFGLDHPQEIRVDYQYGLNVLDGGPAVEEDDIYLFNESHSGTLAYSIRAGALSVTRLRVRSGWSAYHNRARSHVPLEAAVGESLFFLDNALKVYIEAGLRAGWARSPQYDLLGPTALVAGAYMTPLWDLELLVSYSYRWTAYPDSTGVAYAFDYTSPNLRREDSQHNLTVELGRSFLERHLRIGVRYHLMDSASTIDVYDYTRHVAEIFIGGGYR